MNKKVVVILCLLSSLLSAQTVLESKLSWSGKSSSLFSNDRSVLNVNFIKEYQLDDLNSDTIFYVTLTIHQVITEQVGYSNSLGLALTAYSYGAASAVSNQYYYNKKTGSLTLDLETVQEFKSAANKIYTFSLKRNTPPSISWIKVKDLTLSATVAEDEQPAYFLGLNEAVYQMDEKDFKSIMQIIIHAEKVMMR